MAALKLGRAFDCGPTPNAKAERTRPASAASGSKILLNRALDRTLSRSSRRLCAHLQIGMAMDNPPTVCLATKYHCSAQCLSG